MRFKAPVYTGLTVNNEPRYLTRFPKPKKRMECFSRFWKMKRIY